jgi:hypothetical protein
MSDEMCMSYFRRAQERGQAWKGELVRKLTWMTTSLWSMTFLRWFMNAFALESLSMMLGSRGT